MRGMLKILHNVKKITEKTPAYVVKNLRTAPQGWSPWMGVIECEKSTFDSK